MKTWKRQREAELDAEIRSQVDESIGDRTRKTE